MVVCKYYQQGFCRYGQYCKNEHGSFGVNNTSLGKICIDGKNIVLFVAEEVLVAERGGQWILSCFSPFKEKPCIPGFEDFSPEEVRWEMYQAEKNGTVDGMKIQFQQLCQDVKAKREALKHPTQETVLMLEKIQEGRYDGGSNSSSSSFGGTNAPVKATNSTFSFANPQLGAASAANNVFGAKSVPGFGGATTGNPFGGVGGAGGGFTGATSTTSSIFGRPSGSTTSVFGGKPFFGGNPVFGSGALSSTSMFGAAKPATNPGTSVFGTSQIFGTRTTQSGGSIFGGSSAVTASSSGAVSSTSVFGQPATFGASFRPSSQTTNSVFGGGVTSSTTTSPSSSGSLFGGNQTSSGSIFGGGGAPQGSIFGGNGNSGGIFGGQTNFGAMNFDATTMTSTPTLTATTTTTATTGSGPFGSQTPFGSGTTGATSFSTPFGVPATPFSQPTTVFGMTPQQDAAPAFGTTPVSNPFAPKTQQGVAASPFGVIPTSTTTVPRPGSQSVFGSTDKTSFGATTLPDDDQVFSLDGQLTDDEKNAYLAERFVMGKIPLKPPTKELN